jgi:hypothetical protein
MPDIQETPARPAQPEINPGAPHTPSPQYNPQPADPQPAETPSTPETPPSA